MKIRKVICTVCGWGGNPAHRVTVEPKEGKKSFKINKVSCQNCGKNKMIDIPNFLQNINVNIIPC